MLSSKFSLSTSSTFAFPSQRKRGNTSAIKYKECVQNFHNNKNKNLQELHSLKVCLPLIFFDSLKILSYIS